MRNRTLLATAFVVPLLVLACDRADQAPTTATPSQERQAREQTQPDTTMRSSPPATATSPGAASPTPSSPPSVTPSPGDTATERPAAPAD